MIHFICAVAFWGGLLYYVALSAIHVAGKIWPDISGPLIEKTVEGMADDYANNSILIEPWFVISSNLLWGLVIVFAGMFLEVFLLAWIVFAVSYLWLNTHRYNQFYHPAWDLGEKLRQDARYDRMFKALDSLEDYNRKKYKDFE